MSKKANPAVIGAFVIGATLLAVVAILVFGSGKLFRTTDTLVTYFDGTLRGLRAGACDGVSGLPRRRVLLLEA